MGKKRSDVEHEGTKRRRRHIAANKIDLRDANDATHVATSLGFLKHLELKSAIVYCNEILSSILLR